MDKAYNPAHHSFALGTDSEGDADTETPGARTVNAADVTGSGRGRYSRDTVATRRTHAESQTRAMRTWRQCRPRPLQAARVGRTLTLTLTLTLTPHCVKAATASHPCELHGRGMVRCDDGP